MWNGEISDWLFAGSGLGSVMASISLSDLIDVLETLAPPERAAEWDNTGLILEASSDQSVARILLTLDLTAEVVAEALDLGVQAIVAYHPPIFNGLKQFNRADPVAAPLLDLIAAGVNVYSPHTALDAAPDGMSDWLADLFDALACGSVEDSGRHVTLRNALTPEALGSLLLQGLGLPYLRQALAASGAEKIRTLALCPGAGASVLANEDVDAVVTGEMKHHDILAFTRRGVHVFMSEHSHTERPYLAVFRERLLARLPEGVEVLLSRADKDPVVLVMGHA